MTRLEIIKQAKKNKKMTLQEIADLSGVPKRTVDDIFSGHTKNPRIDTVQAIERVLGLVPTEQTTRQAIRPITLTDREVAWLDVLNCADRKFGEGYADGLMLAIKVQLDFLN